MPHFADHLLDRIRTLDAPICVGFDPVYERLPADLCDRVAADGGTELEAIVGFAAQVFDRIVRYAPCVKVQSACFERYGAAGVEACEFIMEQGRALGLIVILDAKRGDIGTSAAHYAAATLGDAADEMSTADAVTVNSYFGIDGLTPFLNTAAERGKGVFTLVRTSNPGGDAIQGLRLEDGRTVAEAVGGVVAEIGDEPRYLGDSGYSLLGAVVGATKPADAARLRQIMPRQIFLVPGFGAQGGGEEGVRACFHDDGTGAIITASRSIIYAHETAGDRPEYAGGGWINAVEDAIVEMKERVRGALR